MPAVVMAVFAALWYIVALAFSCLWVLTSALSAVSYYVAVCIEFRFLLVCLSAHNMIQWFTFALCWSPLQRSSWAIWCRWPFGHSNSRENNCILFEEEHQPWYAQEGIDDVMRSLNRGPVSRLATALFCSPIPLCIWTAGLSNHDIMLMNGSWLMNLHPSIRCKRFQWWYHVLIL